MTKHRILVASSAAVIIFAVFAFAPPRYALAHKSFDMSVAYVQEGAPVQLESVTHTLDFLLSKSEVKNISNNTVRFVTFGVLLSQPGSSDVFLAARQEVPTDIKPGAVRSVDVLALPVKEAQQKALQFRSNKVTAMFGVMEVRFEDGTLWTVDPVKNGGFVHGPQGTPSASVIHWTP